MIELTDTQKALLRSMAERAERDERHYPPNQLWRIWRGSWHHGTETALERAGLLAPVAKRPNYLRATAKGRKIGKRLRAEEAQDMRRELLIRRMVEWSGDLEPLVAEARERQAAQS